MSEFIKYLKANQHSGNCTRAEAFTMGQRSRQSEIDQLKAEKAGLEESINHISEMNFKSISFEHDLFDKGWNQASRQNVENIFRLTGVGESRLKALRGGHE